MALDVATGTVLTGTGAPGTTFSVTGLPFAPKVVLFFWTGRTAVGQAEGDYKHGVGYMVGLADRGCTSTQSDHGVTPTATDNTLRDDAAICLLTTAGAVDGLADFQSFNADGFTCVIDDTFVASYLLHYLALGGTALTDVKSVSVVAPASPQTQDVVVGFQPDCVLCFGPGNPGLNAIGTDSQYSFGVAAGTPPVNAVLAGGGDDAQAASVTSSYCRLGECLARLVNGNALFDSAAVTAWLATGFRLNWTNANGANTFRVLCLKGGGYAVGDALTRTDTTPIVEPTTVQPKALLVASHNKVQSTVNVVQTPDERSLGFVTGPTARNYASVIDKHAVNPTDSGQADGTDALYANQSTAATIALEGTMDLVQFDAQASFQTVMTLADPVASFWWYLAFGDGVAVQSGQPSVSGMRKAGSVAGLLRMTDPEAQDALLTLLRQVRERLEAELHA